MALTLLMPTNAIVAGVAVDVGVGVAVLVALAVAVGVAVLVAVGVAVSVAVAVGIGVGVGVTVGVGVAVGFTLGVGVGVGVIVCLGQPGRFAGHPFHVKRNVDPDACALAEVATIARATNPRVNITVSDRAVAAPNFVR